MTSNRLEPLMTVEEAAAVLKVAPKTLRNRVSLGLMGAVRIGGTLRFERSEIARLIEQGRTRRAS
jgi:excisionase family DNA binding protein